MEEKSETCQFCELSTDIQFNCTDCNLLLCNSCNYKIHSKIASLIEHKVTEILTKSKNTCNEHLDLKRMNCSIHHEQTCFAVCQHCEKSICCSCLVKSEDKKKLKDIYVEKCQKLREYSDKIEEDLPFFTENGNRLWKIKEERTGQYNEIKQQILNKEEELKDKIAEQAYSLIQGLDNWWLPQNKEISEEQRFMNEAEKDLKERKNIIDESLKSDKMESVLMAADLVIKEFPKKAVKEISNPNQVKFSTENTTTEVFVGSLLKIPELKILESFDCDVTTYLLNLNEDAILGVNGAKKEIKQFVLNTKNKCVYTKKISKNANIWDATVTSDGKILFTKQGFQLNEIYMIDEENESNPYCYKNIAPLVPLGIHANEDGSIMVGYTDNTRPLYPPIKQSKRGIIIFDQNKTIIQTIDSSANKERLLHMPHTITTNKQNGDICVIDSTSNNWEGRVITLERNGNLKWIYKGYTDTNSEENFKPRGITTTTTGLIFVTCQNTHLVYTLSMNGDLLTYLGEQKGIETPKGLTSNEDDDIFVGCHRKLHILKASFN